MDADRKRRLDLKKFNVKYYFQISNLSPHKLKKLCRVCGKKCAQSNSFSMREKHIVKSFLETYLQIQINEDDVLPYLVCEKCTRHLIDWDFIFKSSQAFENALSKYKILDSNNSVEKIYSSVDKTIYEVINAIYSDPLQIQNESIQSDRIENNCHFQESSELIVPDIIQSLQKVEENIQDMDIQENTETDIKVNMEDDTPIVERNDMEPSNLTENDRPICDSTVNTQEVEYSIEVQSITLQCAIKQEEIQEDDINDVDCEPMQSQSVIHTSVEQQTESLETVQIKTEPFDENDVDWEPMQCQSDSSVEQQSENLLEAQIKTEPKENIPLKDPLKITITDYKYNIKNNIPNQIINPENILLKDPLEITRNVDIKNIIPSHITDCIEENELCAELNEQNACESARSNQSTIDTCNNNIQLTFNLNNNNDIIIISKFPSLKVSLEPINNVELKSSKPLEEICSLTINNNSNESVVKYLKEEINKPTQDNVKTKYCIICKNYVENLRNHLQDSHAENVNANRVLHDENVDIQYKILNSVLKTQKIKHKSRRQSNTDSESKILSIDHIRVQLCYDKILDLLPENIKKISNEDKLLHLYGKKLIEKSGTKINTNLYVCISNKLEQLVNVLLTSKKLDSNINNLTSLCISENCDVIFNAIRKIGQYNVLTCCYRYPKIVNEIGIAIKQYTKIANQIDTKYVDKYQSFLRVFNKLFKNEMILAENSIVFSYTNNSKKRKAAESQ